MVECTYLDIPQVPETYEVLLSRPFWLWGCEMGINEFGDAIGNEAVFTGQPCEKAPGLIGMDFIHLSLERADGARDALDTSCVRICHRAPAIEALQDSVEQIQ
jgi:hypothetical protein